MTQSLFYVQEGRGNVQRRRALGEPGNFHFATCSVAIALTSKDPRHKRYVFAICVHQVLTKERVASLTGICPGKATRNQAFFYALKHLSVHVNDKVQVAILVILSGKCGPGWQPTSTVLIYVKGSSMRISIRSDCFSSAPRNSTPTTTGAKAKQAALLARPEEILDLQRHVDEDTRDILIVAAERMDILLRDKSHFLHKKDQVDTPAKVPLIQQKRDLLAHPGPS